MNPITLILTIIGLIIMAVIGYLQVIVPFIKGEVKFSKRWPFVVSVKDTSPGGAKLRREGNLELSGMKKEQGEVAGIDLRTGDEGMESINSIAVLPFADISVQKDQEYFCDGVAEEIINALAKVDGLHVVARTSAFAFKGKNEDVREVGKKLNVSTVLEGSVRKAGNKVRLTAQLVSVGDGYHLWSETYNRELTDIFAIQSDIAEQIAVALKPQVSCAEKERIEKRLTSNLEAYTLYLKGRYFWNKRTEEGLNKSIGYFNEAIESDPDYALAYVGLADTYSLLCSYHILPPKECIPRAREAVAKAMDIDDTLAEAYESAAHVRILYDWDWKDAEGEFNRAIELNPGYAIAHQRYALYLTVMGRLDEATAEIRRAQMFDPLSLIINADVGLIFYISRLYDQAIQQCQNTLEIDPNFCVARFALGLAYEQKRMYEEAVAQFQQAITLSGGITALIAALGHAYGVSGKKEEASRVLGELEDLSKRRYVSASSIATIYAGLEEENQVFKWLQRAYEERSVWSIHLHLKVDPRFDGVRSDPRFTTLLKEMGFEN